MKTGIESDQVITMNGERNIERENNEDERSRPTD